MPMVAIMCKLGLYMHIYIILYPFISNPSSYNIKKFLSSVSACMGWKIFVRVIQFILCIILINKWIVCFKVYYR